MTIAQRHIIQKMNTIHNVKVYMRGEQDTLIVFSHNRSKDQYLSYRIGYKGTADLLSVIKATKEVDQQFKEMSSLRDWR
jgi:hypothetical protein